uniref:Uncharacterized protein n=1 Tax=Lepeophtheirus salmonis TaxID=72036 RepID=A0A0K2T7A2_LEPSM
MFINSGAPFWIYIC